MTVEAGQLLLHYRLVEKLGEGGMGVVWAAEDTRLRRRVALKVLPEARAADPGRRARFEREARAAAALNHPNIVTLHSVEEAATPAGPVRFITMELVEGQTLRRLLPADGLALDRWLRIAVPLADAVGQAHRAGITHRDLKPENVMIDRQGRLRVLDFGLAKLQEPEEPAGDAAAPTVASGTAEGRWLGTVAYMSPEQAEGRDVDARSDVFSLGTVLHEMATGSRPFDGDTAMSTVAAILRDEPASVADARPSWPGHAARIVQRCLAKDPDRRYQTALDLRNDLDELEREVAAGLPPAGAAGAVGRSRPRQRRGGRRLLLALAALVALALSFPVLRWARREPPPRVRVSVPLTSAAGQDAGPTWSPGADFIAFERMRAGSFDVMVQPVAGGEATIRAGGPGDDGPPRWSPDGRFLAYLTTSEPGNPIMLVPPHGGTPRKLIETGIATLDSGNSDACLGDHPWDPESRTLLVSRVTESGPLAIYRVDRDDGEAEQLTFPPARSDDRSASFSFDGRRIVFERRSQSRGALLGVPASGGEPEVLLSDAFDNNSPAFRPDGRHVLYLSDRGTAGFDLWELDLQTGSSSQLTFESNDVGSFAVSASDRIAYAPFWHDTFIYRVDVATGERRQLTSHTKDNFGARVSPDGGTIAYHSTRTGNAEIFLRHLDGRPETRITDHPGWDVSPDWSPDGRQLIFASSRIDDTFRLFVVNADGGGERPLVDMPVSVRDAFGPAAVVSLVTRWAPEGDRIGFLVTNDETTSLWTVRPDGRGAQEVVRDVRSFDWYLDGRRVIYARRHGSHTELVARDLGTGEERSLFVGPLSEMEVAPDGSAVAFCYGPGHMATGLAVLRLLPPVEPGGLPTAAGEAEYVVRSEGTWHVHAGGWAPDSGSFVYTQDQDHGDLYELVEKR